MSCDTGRWRAGLAAVTALLSLGACSSDAPPSLLGGESDASGGGTAGGRAAGGSGGGASDAGGSGPNGGGTANDGGSSGLPVAAFPSELGVDVGCNGVTPDANLLIRNAGDEPLVISSANADSGYVVATTLPLEIAPGASGALLVTPPAPSADADAGAMSTGKLSFTTNEPGTPTHEITLTTTLFVGSFELTDADGSPIQTLTLAYDSGGSCPDLGTYRIHNTGNVAFTVFGPTFPAHFSGASLGAAGHAIAPGGYAELQVGAVSAPDSSCSAPTGQLAFTVMGVFCGAVPKLSVAWPVSSAAAPPCACTVPAF